MKEERKYQPKRARQRKSPQRDASVSIRSDRRDPADARKFGCVLISLATAEADAEAQHRERTEGQDTPKEAA